jgi:hypothetical protein
MSQYTIRWIPLLLSISISGTIAVGKEFAVQNRVMRDSQMLSESLTLLTDDAIFDVLQNAGERRISIYFPNKREFRVLDLEKEVQVVVAKKDLDQMVLELTERAKRERTPFIRFAAAPQFSETRDANRLSLKSRFWTYNVEFEDGKAPEFAKDYRRFADAFVRLNAIWSPLPPNARLQLNERLENLNALPKTVRVEIPNDQPRTSYHDYHWSLSESDLKYIETAKDGQDRFPVVGLNAFRTKSLTMKKSKKRSR